jgi:four helix bundle protein
MRSSSCWIGGLILQEFGRLGVGDIIEDRGASQPLNFAEWVNSVPAEIRNDPIWDLEVYRLALLTSEVADRDAQVLRPNLRMRSVAGQLAAAAATISTNLREGSSRDASAERVQFYEYALTATRECREWYETARTALPDLVIKHRLELIAAIVGMITSLIPDERTRPASEAPDEGGMTARSRRVLFEDPIPFA